MYTLGIAGLRLKLYLKLVSCSLNYSLQKLMRLLKISFVWYHNQKFVIIILISFTETPALT